MRFAHRCSEQVWTRMVSTSGVSQPAVRVLVRRRTGTETAVRVSKLVHLRLGGLENGPNL